MADTSALKILKAARAKIADPKDWGQGPRVARPNYNSHCAAEAIEACAHPSLLERPRAIRALRNAAGVDRGHLITDWNDDPERKHSEVLAAFNLAIAVVRLS